MEADRLNSPSTFTMTMEVLGHELRFYQDPNSKHLGTTVWDASLVFVKFLEKNCRRGKFSPSKLKGKRVIELGAGCGLAGFGMALLGCDVVATDQRDVLPILARNIERNTPSLAQMNPSDSFGSIRAAELDWGNEYHIMAVGPPFDFIIGTDVVYAEHLLEPLLKTIHALSGPKTTIMLGYEIRSTNVHEQMLEMWKKNFEVKTVSQSKMDSQYQHPSIQLYIMGLKSAAGNAENTRDNIQQEIDTVCSRQENDKKDVSYDEKEIQEAEEPVRGDEDKKLGNWETRRMGSMAARLLQDVKIA
ncbi:protein N-lysine methyltransferase METTL21A [Benincasa hispida]|uniref:protein N-lysine methyltransferase METTL21A n=2 Tax=Benincasa hispida TaxID=102211 RepID=UPI0018FFBBDF|nr:protein N-lysine methyltransferase METTL21A [Benincasa hispida]XP_038901724.1 protein N-lysine methyltransferase METTL21A [Benincasa hispida]XP_038901725.1 protein N-lysine methyltransferase METTL21A [Benincasa hispida]